MEKNSAIERPNFDSNKENNMRKFINYLRNNTEEVVVEAERKFWTNHCKEVGVEPFLIDVHVKQQIGFTMGKKKLFDSMTEQEVEQYIQTEMKRIEDLEGFQSKKR